MNSKCKTNQVVKKQCTCTNKVCGQEVNIYLKNKTNCEESKAEADGYSHYMSGHWNILLEAHMICVVSWLGSVQTSFPYMPYKVHWQNSPTNKTSQLEHGCGPVPMVTTVLTTQIEEVCPGYSTGHISSTYSLWGLLATSWFTVWQWWTAPLRDVAVFQL